MNLISLHPLAVAGLFALGTFGARADEERDLIRILQSDADISAKAEACKKLRWVGTPTSVPALTALLEEERISHAARFALEGMEYPEAVTALRQAIRTTSGLAKVGVIDSLGWRRDVEAVQFLQPLLFDSDPTLAAAAASALGRIGGPEALAALKAAPNKVELRPVVLDGLLAGAESLLAEGRDGEAREIYRSLVKPTEEESLRVAAFTGWIRAAGDGALDMIISGLSGDDPAAQTAALRSAGELKSPAATRAFVEMLPKSSPGQQIALLAVLQRRGDDVALPAVLTTIDRSVDLSVRAAALAALGAVGNASVVPILADVAASTNAAEQVAAREALLVLRRGDVTGALLSFVEVVTPPVQRELFTALSGRADPSAVPGLLALARSLRPGTRERALQALGNLADGSHMHDLVRLLDEATDMPSREDVRSVFETLVERYSDTSSLDAAPLVKGLAEEEVETRKVLLQVAALFVDSRVRAAFRTALQEGDERMRSAAARALCATRDPALLPDLLGVARRSTDPQLRSLALEGGVRLITADDSTFSMQERSETLAAAFAIAVRPEDKRTILSGLSHVPHRSALELAERACADPMVRAEAEFACLQIARRLGPPDFAASKTSLARLAAGAINRAVQTNAQAALKTLESGLSQNAVGKKEQ